MKGFVYQCDVCLAVTFPEKMPTVQKPPPGWIKIYIGADEGDPTPPSVEICSVTCLMNSKKLLEERGVWS